MHRRSPFVATGFLAVLAGCGSPQTYVRAEAAKTLQCSADQLVVSPMDEQGGGGLYYVEGCGRIARYVITGCDGALGCRVYSGADVSTLVARQSAFDFACSAPDVKVTMINPGTFGAVGCGQHRSYVLECNVNTCRIVQNTSAN
jgi:hypothetical protein